MGTQWDAGLLLQGEEGSGRGAWRTTARRRQLAALWLGCGNIVMLDCDEQRPGVQ
jgi:hypothetical protein